MILFYADNVERAKFWMFLEDRIKCSSKNIYLVNEINVYLFLLLKGKKAIIVSRLPSNVNVNCNDSLQENYEVLSKQISLPCAMKLHAAVKRTCQNIDFSELEFFFVWNGESIIAKAILSSLPNYIKCRFFEISNLPGKIFVDRSGTNARSFYYSNYKSINPSLNDQMVYSDYVKWRSKYIQGISIPKQVKNRGFKSYIFSLVNETIKYIGYSFLEIVPRSEKSFSQTVKSLSKFHFCKKDEPSTIRINLNRYVFLPFQVSNDTQVIINSDVDNFGAFDIAYKFASDNDLKLVVKMHPAEENLDYLARLIKHCQLHDVDIVDMDTIKLIKAAEHVITINSTVGLQSMIMGKPTTVLGRAIYKSFSEDDLAIYITRYLINVDYFSHDCSFNEISRILHDR